MLKIDSVEKLNYQDEEVMVDNVSITYTQNSDCTQSDDSVQSITISTANNGVARFIYFSTERWSISDIDDIVKILEDFKKRAGLEAKEK